MGFVSFLKGFLPKDPRKLSQPMMKRIFMHNPTRVKDGDPEPVFSQFLYYSMHTRIQSIVLAPF